MLFKLPQALQILRRTPAVIQTLLEGLSEEWTHSNEGAETWSAFDIVGHYIHGENTDWIPRAKIILSEQADKTFEPFDRFAQFTNSKGKTLTQLLEEFKVLRARNLAELESLNLTEESLDRTGVHPTFGEVTLRQLLAAWVVHDLTHLHQLSRVIGKQYVEAVGPWKEFMGVLR